MFFRVERVRKPAALWLIGATLPPSCRALFPVLHPSGQTLNTAFFRFLSQALLQGVAEIGVEISTSAIEREESPFIVEPRIRVTGAVGAQFSRDV